jgi:hypothetical protein
MQNIIIQFFLQVFLCNNTAGYQDYVASVVDEWNMSVEHWWEGPDRKKLKYFGGEPVKCHIFYHTSCVDSFEIDPDVYRRGPWLST